jgi:Putative endonuclease segE, GIY-YIG domain/NUMOD3 motif
MKAYTYLLKFKPENKYYYGVRFQNIRLKRNPEDDFMIHYTTSSEQINNLLQEHGVDSFEWQIRKIFDTAEQAILWETKVLRRAKVLKRQDIWYNANVAGYKITTPKGRQKIRETHTGVTKTDNHKEKIRLSNLGKNKGRVQTEEHRRKNSEAHRGENNIRWGVEVLQSTRDKISKANKGKVPANKGIPMTEEQKAAIRATKAATKTYLTCEHCSKTVYKPNYFQHHGNKCKHKP